MNSWNKNYYTILEKLINKNKQIKSLEYIKNQIEKPSTIKNDKTILSSNVPMTSSQKIKFKTPCLPTG